MAPSRSRQLLHKIALLAFVAMLATGIVMRDVEAIAFSIAVLGGVLLLPLRNGLLGRIVLGIVFLDAAFWMLPAAASNVRHHDQVAYVVAPVGLAAIAVAGIVAAVGISTLIVPLALLVAGGGAVAASQTIADAPASRTSDLALSAKGVRFSPTRLTARNGELSVRLKNKDLFWHTLTIDALNLDLKVPVGATRRAEFQAPAGTYEYYCRIPGHKQAGMKGTLRVS
ncbi:MAG TPA: cupredoxin domain-containing protein [Acidimicrobiales bacterium]|nr:cupredoxin domain-containing protein [Acidimicrobiales bacterium]